MLAHDLAFGDTVESLSFAPGHAEAIPAGSEPVRAGWIGGDGPGIEAESWPRSPATGLPMVHIVSLRLPVDYQRRGPDFPAISFFAGEGQCAAPVSQADGADPFVEQWRQYRPHPQFRELEDIIGGRWGLLWLTEDEFARRTPAPPDVRVGDSHRDESEGANAWDDSFAELGVWLIERADPNAGIAPTEYGDSAYDHEAAREAYGRSHLGGTTYCVQAIPDGLTPFYLELEEFGPLNFGGGGNAQIDVESDTFDWACT